MLRRFFRFPRIPFLRRPRIGYGTVQRAGRLLEKQKAQLEHQHHISDSKAIIFDMMIDLAEKEYNIDIRKNSLPGQSSPSARKNKKA